MATKTKWKVGDSRSLSRVVSAELVQAFAAISGDRNPVHLCSEHAATTIFKKPIAHGMLVSSFISAVIAMEIPGPGAIYLDQKLRFCKPVFFGDEVTTTVTIDSYDEIKGRMSLKTICRNQNGDEVISGEALVVYR